MKPFDLFGRIYELPAPARNALLSAGIPRVLPIARGLGIKVRSLDEERCETSMPFSRRARNHVGTIYLGALMVHAETTMAVLVLGLCRPPRFRVLVKRNEADYHAAAKGTVRGICAPEGEEREALLRLRALEEGKGEAWVTVRTEAASDGRHLATTRFLVSVKRMA